MDNRYAAVVDVLSIYFDGLYHSDAAALTRIFHPQARYVGATEAPILHLSMAEYLPLVANRPSPASRNEARRDRIVSIEFAGPVAAFARVNCSIGPKYFTDLLTLILVDGRWQIIAKVFHFEAVDPPRAG